MFRHIRSAWGGIATAVPAVLVASIGTCRALPETRPTGAPAAALSRKPVQEGME